MHYHSAGWGEAHHLRLWTTEAEESHHQWIHAQLEDADGNPVLDDARFVRWNAAGGAELTVDQGTASGSQRVNWPTALPKSKPTTGPANIASSRMQRNSKRNHSHNPSYSRRSLALSRLLSVSTNNRPALSSV